MRKINLGITGCMGRMGQQLIKSSRKDINFKLVTLTENKLVNNKFYGIKPELNSDKAFKKAISWLNRDGLIYIEVPNMANSLKPKGFGSLHMAHTVGFGRYSLELLGAFSGMVPFEVFDEFDIGIIFKEGKPRPLDEIKRNSIDEFNNLTSKQVNKRFWLYFLMKT